MEASEGQRLRRLLDLAGRELEHLRRTDRRLFRRGLPLDPGDLQDLEEDEDLSERLDAFVARFGRLQDTLGARLLPAFLRAMGEEPGTVLENLDRAERLGLLASAEDWQAIRKLRKRMIHEYVDDPEELAAALNQAHRFVPQLAAFLEALRARLQGRL